MLKDNPKYKVVFHSKVHNIDFYAPVSDGDYYMSRYIAAGAQNVYSSLGASRELLERYLKKMLELCNNEKSKDTIRTDVGTLCNNLLYRLRYPVDEDCALRMGAIYVFMESEDPEAINPKETEKKVMMAKGNFDYNLAPDPELYAFFLSIGIQSTPSWTGYETNTQTEYFSERSEALQKMNIPA